MDVDQSWEAIPNRGYAAAEKKKRIFLKRGEGMQRRVLAPMSRKIRPIKDSDDKSGREGNDLSWQGDKGRPVHGQAGQHGSRKMTPDQETRSFIEDDLDELAAESSLIDVDTERGEIEIDLFWGRFGDRFLIHTNPVNTLQMLEDGHGLLQSL